jgi:hypothetical protein
MGIELPEFQRRLERKVKKGRPGLRAMYERLCSVDGVEASQLGACPVCGRQILPPPEPDPIRRAASPRSREGRAAASLLQALQRRGTPARTRSRCTSAAEDVWTRAPAWRVLPGRSSAAGLGQSAHPARPHSALVKSNNTAKGGQQAWGRRRRTTAPDFSARSRSHQAIARAVNRLRGESWAVNCPLAQSGEREVDRGEDREGVRCYTAANTAGSIHRRPPSGPAITGPDSFRIG